jgi:arginase family enzyme
MLTIERYIEDGIATVIAHIHRAVGNKQVYLSLDIDVVDPA